MTKNSTWQKYYKKTPPEKVPWNATPHDYLSELLEAGKLGQGKALDLGCGVGRKSILLAKHGFDVTGVDIAAEAIKQAEANAEAESVEVKFVAEDATDLSFLGDEKFDLVLDWSNLHGIPAEKQVRYVSEIAKHSKSGAKLVLRCFNKTGASPNTLGFITVMGNIMIFSDKDIKKLYGKHFRILETRETKPKHRLTDFSEYLMERI